MSDAFSDLPAESEAAEQTVDDVDCLLTVVYDSSIEERVNGILHHLNVTGWTRLAGAHGYGGGGYRLDTPVWPGSNIVLLVALPHRQALAVSAALRELQSTYRRKPGITLWLQQVTVP